MSNRSCGWRVSTTRSRSCGAAMTRRGFRARRHWKVRTPRSRAGSICCAYLPNERPSRQTIASQLSPGTTSARRTSSNRSNRRRSAVNSAYLPDGSRRTTLGAGRGADDVGNTPRSSRGSSGNSSGGIHVTPFGPQVAQGTPSALCTAIARRIARSTSTISSSGTASAWLSAVRVMRPLLWMNHSAVQTPVVTPTSAARAARARRRARPSRGRARPARCVAFPLAPWRRRVATRRRAE